LTLPNDMCFVAAAKTQILDSALFDELVSKCLIPKHATCCVLKMGACASLIMTMIAWLLPTYWLTPAAFGAGVAQAARQLLTGMMSCLWWLTFDYAVRLREELQYEQRLMKDGKDTFGDDFAAVVQAYVQRLFGATTGPGPQSQQNSWLGGRLPMA
jgi:hypothetical protein